MSQSESPWISVPIFVCSTFRDMQAERDHLRTEVFPRLARKLMAKRVHLEWVDLRWGVDTSRSPREQMRELLVLETCLGEIQRCRPFFIGLLGDRYGWVPPDAALAHAAAQVRHGGDVRGRSVTALEIEYGVLDHPQEEMLYHFYLRDPLPYDQMPPELRARYAEDDPGLQGRLELLKSRLRSRARQRVHTYTAAWDADQMRVVDLAEFGRTVEHHLWVDLVTRLGEYSEDTSAMSWPEKDRWLVDEALATAARDFAGREAIVDELMRFALGPPAADAPTELEVQGEPGSGRRALVAHVAQRLMHERCLVLTHVTGTDERSYHSSTVEARWCAEIASFLDLPWTMLDHDDNYWLGPPLEDLVRRASARCPVIAIVAGLSPGSRDCGWRIICTGRPPRGKPPSGFAPDPTRRQLLLPPLSLQDARQIVAALCHRHHRSLAPDLREALLAKTRDDGQPAWHTPLWIELALERLHGLNADDFQRAEDGFEGSAEERLRAMLGTVIAELPDTVEGLYEQLLERAEASWEDREGCRLLLSILAIAEWGRTWDLGYLAYMLRRPPGVPDYRWRAEWLRTHGEPTVRDADTGTQVTPDRASEPYWQAALERSLLGHLVVPRYASEGTATFRYPQLPEAVLRRYLPDTEARLRFLARVRAEADHERVIGRSKIDAQVTSLLAELVAYAEPSTEGLQPLLALLERDELKSLDLEGLYVGKLGQRLLMADRAEKAKLLMAVVWYHQPEGLWKRCLRGHLADIQSEMGYLTAAVQAHVQSIQDDRAGTVGLPEPQDVYAVHRLARTLTVRGRLSEAWKVLSAENSRLRDHPQAANEALRRASREELSSLLDGDSAADVYAHTTWEGWHAAAASFYRAATLAHAAAGDTEKALGQGAKAIEFVDRPYRAGRSCSRDRQRAWTHLAVGELHETTGEVELALEHYQTASSVTQAACCWPCLEAWLECHLARARAEDLSGDLTAAVRTLRGVRESPDLADGSPYWLLANAQTALEHWRMAAARGKATTSELDMLTHVCKVLRALARRDPDRIRWVALRAQCCRRHVELSRAAAQPSAFEADQAEALAILQAHKLPLETALRLRHPDY